jgi:hypothetical protein
MPGNNIVTMRMETFSVLPGDDVICPRIHISEFITIHATVPCTRDHHRRPTVNMTALVSEPVVHCSTAHDESARFYDATEVCDDISHEFLYALGRACVEQHK